MTTTTTKPARDSLAPTGTKLSVLTEEQRHELWELFCSYGTLSWEAESTRWRTGHEEAKRLRHEADEVQERFGDLLWSLTEPPS